MIPLFLAALPLVQDAPATLDGHWRGAVVRDGSVLPLELAFDGSAEVLVDVPTWGFFALPLPYQYEPPALQVPFGGSRFQLEVEPLTGTMRGKLVDRGQAEEEGHLVELTRMLAPALPPVRVEEVRFASSDGVELAGTLALPAGAGPHPAMVIVQGRSYGSRLQFRSHAILAARRGLVGLAFDGRGTGDSGGVRGEHTLAQRLDDAQAALELVREHPQVDAERVGMFGHSSGGWIVPVVAQRSPPVAFLVLHSGPAEPLGDQQGHVCQALAQRAGIEPTEAELAEILAFYREVTALAAAGAPWSDIEPLAAAARESRWGPHVPVPDGPDDANLGYYRRVPHDSTAALRATRTPLLALFGRDDFVVRPEINVPLLEEHLRAAGNEDHRIVVFEEADHDLMIPEREESPYRWQRRPPGYFELIFDWVGERVRSD